MEQKLKDILKAVELVNGKVNVTPEIVHFLEYELRPFIKKLTILSTKKNVDSLALTTTVITGIFRQVKKKSKLPLLESLLETLLLEDEIIEKTKLVRELIKRMEAERVGVA